MLAERLKTLRKENGMSQQRLADLLGLGQSTVAMWEKGKNSPEYESLINIANIFNVSIDYLAGQKTSRLSHRIPVLGYVRAGIPTEAVEEVLDYEDVTLPESEAGNYFALRIKGDSMAPRMMEGDTIIVRKQSDCASGDICVALVGSGDATVKKVIKKDSGIILMPLNACYDPLVFTTDEIEAFPVTIIGKVTELRAKI
ncbi:MAG: helix-turn-helix domain-containing protein [Clostridia bacterium]|nr:helix-turn-helix domain-containing protein [Clostridia bacterium]